MMLFFACGRFSDSLVSYCIMYLSTYEDCSGFCFTVSALMYTDTGQSIVSTKLLRTRLAPGCWWSIQEGWYTQSELQMIPVESCGTKGFLCDWLYSPVNNWYVCSSLSAPKNSQNVFQSSVMLIPNQLGQSGRSDMIHAQCDSGKQLIGYDNISVGLCDCFWSCFCSWGSGMMAYSAKSENLRP